MFELAFSLFDTSGFPARWNCGDAWATEEWLGWTHIVADSLTFAAYYAVPFVVAYFVIRKPEVRFTAAFWTFFALIFLSCGTGHLIEAIMFWFPIYRLSAVTKLLTAGVSTVGVFVLAKSLPRALDLKTPEQLEREIIERQQAESQLELERSLLHTLMNHLPDAIYFKDENGNFLRISQSLAARLCLADPASAIGKGAKEYFPADFVERVASDEEQVRLTGVAIESEEEKPVWPDGTSNWLLTTRSPLRRRNGETIGIVGISRDISRLKAAEEELIAAKDEAVQANRAKSQFLANMSHEIRTPLNAVIGLTEVVLRTELEKQQRGHLRTVIDSAESLLSIINDILDFSKIEAGKLHLETVPFNLHDVVGDTLRSLSVRADYKQLELACFIEPSLPEELIGDPVRLRQLLTNLVSNALKFTESGEVVVRVKQVSTNETLQLHFSVSDTGIGIEPDQLKRLFQPFSQADASTTRRYGGTGLGLSICRQIVSLMGGRIWAESVSGGGSTFHFTAGFEVSSKGRTRRRHESQPLVGTRILVVDDNDTNRMILDEVTRAKGMQPVLAASADDALSKLSTALDQNEPFQLLLTDMHMPDRDGYDLIESVRQDSRFDSLPIIILTSAHEPSDLARCLKLRVSEHLTKPVKQSELFEVLVRTLGIEEQLVKDGRLHLDGESQIRVPPQKILLVEDSRANQRVALAILNEHGHRVTVAENGRQALAILDEDDFDIVLMDVQMPEMDGYEATAEIRRQEQQTQRHQTILAMTAHAVSGDRERCLAAGMDDYLSKPIRREELFAALKRAATLTENGSAGAEPGTQRAALASPEDENSSSVSINDDAAIDMTRLLAQLNGSHTLVREITQSYIAETEEKLSGLADALAAGDSAAFRRHAHTIKGCMQVYGAEKARNMAQELEQMGANGDLSETERLLDQAEQEFRNILKQLQAWMEH